MLKWQGVLCVKDRTIVVGTITRQFRDGPYLAYKFSQKFSLLKTGNPKLLGTCEAPEHAKLLVEKEVAKWTSKVKKPLMKS